jgi:hypothetical protein
VAKFVLTNVRYFAGGVDLTANTNKVEISASVEEKDATNFGSNGWTELLGGLRSAEVTASGQWEAGDATFPDDGLWSTLTSSAAAAWSIAPAGAADGALAYLGQMVETSYGLTGSVGDVAAFDAAGASSGLLARGVIAHPPGTARSASGTGTSINLGAVAAGQRLVAAVHILSVTGTLSITPRVETDTATGFPSATTPSGLTGTAATSASTGTGQWLASDGTAQTDTWQRAAWTATGTGSALFVVTVGIV